MCKRGIGRILIFMIAVCGWFSLVCGQEVAEPVNVTEVQSLAAVLSSSNWNRALTPLARMVARSEEKERTVFFPVIDPLLSRVGYGGISRNDSDTALRLLVKIGPPAVPSVLKALKSPQGRLRRSAIEILFQMRPEGIRLVDTIAPFVADPDEFVSRQAIQNLGQLGGEAIAAVPLIQKRLDTEPQPSIALPCHQTLARIQPENPIHLINICGFATDNDPHIRSVAISILGGFGVRAKVHGPDVLACIRDSDSGVRSNAAHTLGEIGYDTDAAIGALIDVLKGDVEREARRSAAGALGTFGSKAKRAVPALVAAVDADGGWWVAVDAIARIDGINSLPFLIEMTDFPEDGVRHSAVRHLGNLGPAAKSALPVLKRRLADERPYIGTAAEKAIQQIEVVPASP